MDEIKTYKEQQVSDFVEAAAHDLHAPLRKLSILIDRVFTKHAEQFSPDANEYITRINTCVEQMRSLIDGLTELATTDAHTFSFIDCDLNVIINETLDTMNEEIREAHATIEVNAMPWWKEVLFSTSSSSRIFLKMRLSSEKKILRPRSA